MKVIALIGSMGSGKTTIFNKLINECNAIPLKEYTSRPRRITEKNSLQYNFIGEQDFLLREETGWLLGVSKFPVSDGSVYKYGFSVTDCYTAKSTNELVVVQANYKNINALKWFFGIDLVTIKLSRNQDDIIKSLSSRGDDPNEIISRLKRDEESYKNIKADYHFHNKSIDDIVKTINLMR